MFEQQARRGSRVDGVDRAGWASIAPGKVTLTERLTDQLAGEALSDNRAEPLAGDGDGAARPALGGAGTSEAAGAGAPKAGMKLGAVTINVKQAAIALSQRGSAEYKVQWAVGGGKNGWVIQHVKFRPTVENAAGPVVARTPVTEYWEAWQVRNGAVFVGSTNTPHQSDTFRTASEDAKTKGQIQVLGKVAFAEDYQLSEPPWGHNVPYAGALPTMASAPEGWSEGRAQDHTLKVNYDDIAGTPQTQVGSP